MPDPAAGREPTGPKVANTATNSKVEAQIGYVEGNAVFHKTEKIYQVNNGDSPERKFTVARNHLDGGIPRVAEDLIGQVLDSGLVTTEIAYYYTLSVLSERSLNQLGGKELDKLDRALRAVDGLPVLANDEWRAALNVIGGLLNCVIPADSAIAVPADALQLVIGGLEKIPHARRTEILRHLDMIFDGATQDELDRLNAQTVAVARNAGDRSNRAWMYFHPEPEPPRRAVPAPLENEREKSNAWTAAVFGLGGCAACVVLGIHESTRWGPLALPSGVLLLAGLAAGWFSSTVLALRARRAMRKLDERKYPEPSREDQEEWVEWARKLDARSKYVELIRLWIDFYFVHRLPWIYKMSMDKDKWRAKTEQVRGILLARLVRQYGSAKVPVSRLHWLIRWHARQAVKQWQDAEKLPDYRETLRPDVATIAPLAGGLTVTAGSVVWLIAVASHLGLALTVFCVAEVVAGVVGGVGVTYLVAAHRAVVGEQAELDQIFDGEQQGYERWTERLSRRPTDAEIGNWLDSDKSYLKTYAMKQCGLTNRDVVAHVVLAAGQEKTRRARVRRGPPRYAEYMVLVFLLSYNGVRLVAVELDFLTGAIYNELRRSFRYDALASTTVFEQGFQSANGQRHRIRMGNEWHVTDKESLVIRRSFLLSLVDSDSIPVEVDNYEGLLDDTPGDDKEDKAHLDEISRESSGVAGALQILEAVAAEGREWIAKERERRNRHWQEWHEWKTSALPDPVAITDGGWPRSIDPADPTPN